MAGTLSEQVRDYTLVAVDYYGRSIGRMSLKPMTGREARKVLMRWLAKEMKKSSIVAGGYALRHAGTRD